MLTLNNHNLMLLTQFALKAKPLIGVVKVTELFNNELYTFDILTKAVLTEELVLVDLSKKISYEYKIGFNLINAIASYIHNISHINSNDDFIHKSKSLLTKLANHLYGVKIGGAYYRLAVEAFLLNVENEDKTFSINLARKFYRYWKAANRLVDESNRNEDLKLIDQKKAFIKLWDELDAVFFSHLEMCLLTQYTDSLLNIGLTEKNIVLNSRIAKLIMFELRNEKLTSDDTYRDAINKTQMLFKNEKLEKLFLIVSRELYHFWLGNTTKILSVV